MNHASTITRRNAALRGLRLWFLAQVGLIVAMFTVTAVLLVTLGVGIWLVPVWLKRLRWVVGRSRQRQREWFGVDIPEFYEPEPEYSPGFVGRIERLQFLLTEPATLRDLLWGATAFITGGLVAGLPAFLIVYGAQGFLQTPLWLLLQHHGYHDFYFGIPVSSLITSLLCVPAGAAAIVVGYRYGPGLLAWQSRWTTQVLAPAPEVLERRVRKLEESRAEAVDASAAELRRIERDLHDGAQARLVAMGMTLGAIEHLMEKDPARARELLAETRMASTKALHELRDLVRGIHPPVLADRGLADAVHALALDSPLNVQVTSELTGRFEAPLESAAYFAVSEILTNVAKHANADRVWLDMRHSDGCLRISVTDDGQGGASTSGGTGLRGIERRIGVFDGVLAVNSPIGGPTIVTLEIPSAPPNADG